MSKILIHKKFKGVLFWRFLVKDLIEDFFENQSFLIYKKIKKTKIKASAYDGFKSRRKIGEN